MSEKYWQVKEPISMHIFCFMVAFYGHVIYIVTKYEPSLLVHKMESQANPL